MASQLKVDTLTGVTTAGSILVTGEGNSTTTNLQQGLAKSWASIDGTTTAQLNDSFNLSSCTDQAVGKQRPVFTNNMANTTYAPNSTKGTSVVHYTSSHLDQQYATTGYEIGTRSGSDSSFVDIDVLITTVNGDLA